jgi:poly-gamma-glutamate capsule biosynthesis protein CapA/YwtB (metallophosphatase superfamily)
VRATPTIGLLGDVMLGRKVAERLAARPALELWSPELQAACGACDALVLNLECCASDRGAPTSLIPDKPFFFRAPPGGIDALDAVGASVASVANNHVLDFGPDALTDTLVHLRRAGITAAGAGVAVTDARRGVVVPAGPLRLGVLALSDHPAEYAAGERPGIAHANLRDGLPDWVTGELRRLRSHADVVLAFPHWGPNMTTRPAAWQRERACELLGAGADAVAGHSAHVFHGVERIASGPVLYDLGGALDDYAVDAELRNDLGVLALWRPRAQPDLELIGLRLDFCRTEVANAGDADWIARRLDAACAELGSTIERVDEARFVVR